MVGQQPRTGSAYRSVPRFVVPTSVQRMDPVVGLTVESNVLSRSTYTAVSTSAATMNIVENAGGLASGDRSSESVISASPTTRPAGSIALSMYGPVQRAAVAA